MFVISATNLCVWLAIYLNIAQNPVYSQHDNAVDDVQVHVEPDNVITGEKNSTGSYDSPVSVNARSQESVRLKNSPDYPQNNGMPERHASIPDTGMYDGNYKSQNTRDQQGIEMNRQKMQEAILNTWKILNPKGNPIPDHLMNYFMQNLPLLMNKSPVNNARNNVHWNPNQDSSNNDQDPQYVKQSVGPPYHVPPISPQNMLEAYQKFEKYMMSLQKQLPNSMARKKRTAVPPEFLLEEVFFYPSLNLNANGQISKLPFNNEYSAFTVVVQPGIKDCYFYTPMTHFRIDYQVIHGGGLDIGLFVKAPDGEPIAIRPPVPDASIVINVPPHFRFLSYAVCLDNRKASYAEKQTYLSMDLELNWDKPDTYERYIIEHIQRKYNATDPEIATKMAEYAENLGNVTIGVEGLYARIRRIHRHHQRSSNIALSDKALMEDNLKLVNQGSVFQIVLMLLVAGIQVAVIRSLFDPYNRIYKIWSRKKAPLRGTC